MATNFDGYAEIYYKLRAVDPKKETHILRRITRSSQHAARQHSENVGELVARLFAQTTDLEMDYVKESVFGVSGGPPIMAKDHPAMQELFWTRTREIQSRFLCILLRNDSQCFPFCIQTRCSI